MKLRVLSTQYFFQAKPGETIAFIGSTGSGKSSLVQLIPRFYDVTLGTHFVDGVDVRDYNLKALRPVRLALFHKKPYSLQGLSVKISVMVRKMPVMKN